MAVKSGSGTMTHAASDGGSTVNFVSGPKGTMTHAASDGGTLLNMVGAGSGTMAQAAKDNSSTINLACVGKGTSDTRSGSRPPLLPGTYPDVTPVTSAGGFSV